MMRITVRDFQKMTEAGEKIAVLTAYDATSAFLTEAAGATALLVGDSLGMVVQGHSSTIPVTLEQSIYHAQMVVRSTQRAMIIGDLPFMTYKISTEQAMTSAARMMQESGVGAVKLEGGEYVASSIQRIVQAGIPVMGHIGLTPQSVNQFGGFRVQGKDIFTAQQLLQDALAVEAAGAFSVVLELIPAPLAQEISERLRIPTIGIGAGPHCDGQVQVYHDLLGLHPSFGPRHSKQYANAGRVIQDALSTFIEEVKAGKFPTSENSSTMNAEVLAEIRGH
jgi:3-methyl-2-oxobutanoate hydroxymethyltransferase